MGKIGELLSDEESVKQLSELAQVFMNGSEEGEASAEETKADEELSENVDEQESSGTGFDFGSLLKFTEIMGAMNQKDKNSELLLALKPHLKEERQERVDKAIKMMKLLAIWNVIRDTGLLKDFL